MDGDASACRVPMCDLFVRLGSGDGETHFGHIGSRRGRGETSVPLPYWRAMGSSTGRLFRVTTFGESHGPAVGAVVDGCPPLLDLSPDDIQVDLDRRRPGQSRLVTQRDESDRVEILSGVDGGLTLGTPIALVVHNRDQHPGAYEQMKEVYRPSHADWTTEAKYGIRAVAGGGRASARETVGRVAAAAIARKLLAELVGVEVIAWVEQVHRVRGRIDGSTVRRDHVEADPTRCPDPEAAAEMTAAIEQARRDGDSLGGVVTCVARSVPAGWGEPVFDKLEADLARAAMSLPAAKGVRGGVRIRGGRDDRPGAQRSLRPR